MKHKFIELSTVNMCSLPFLYILMCFIAILQNLKHFKRKKNFIYTGSSLDMHLFNKCITEINS
jgi:hypothetical protein